MLAAALAWASAAAGKGPDREPSPDPGAAMDQLAARARQALAALGAAERALSGGDRTTARERLDAARTILARVYDDAPGWRAAERMSDAESSLRLGAPPEWAPLDRTLSALAAPLDPRVPEGLARAKRLASAGAAEPAAEALALARRRLLLDVALFPIESAYAQAIATQTLVEDGNVEHAHRTLQAVPVVMAELLLRVPLAATRFDLRGAARALQAGDRARAAALAGRAARRLDALALQAGGEIGDELRPLATEAARLAERVPGGRHRPPRPADLEKLAARLAELRAM